MSVQDPGGDHLRMVNAAIKFLQENGYRNIRADVEGSEKPTEVIWQRTGEGYTPDLTAERERFCIFEVDTDDSIEDPHTADRWKLFSTHASDRRGEFFVVVAKGSLTTAWRRLKFLGVEANVWEL